MVSIIADAGAELAILGLCLAGTSGNDDEITFEISGYDAFGNLLTAPIDDANLFRYCWEYWDDETKT
ncbi:MAG: hypothetical protein FWG88_04710 [Oscillospiraceae bacterium]|nr:hypothetical protein [Oscillospiraceae bacterium]